MELNGFTLCFNVHYDQPSHFYRQRNGISSYSHFSVIPNEVMHVFSYVLDNVRVLFPMYARNQILLNMT